MDKNYADGQSDLRKTRLESYESILEALVDRPLMFSELALETQVHQPLLTRHLKFLIQNGLIEERLTQKAGLYAITEKGLTVTRVLNFPKYIRKIKGTIRTIEEAAEVINDLADENKDT
ncbi:MAG TPA: winged helix-turn-helix domain-containing protein [Candidatus Acidoferrum sp.]|nr:winged helix-turn-helix domain-containing protein [Candidatus Acidoferrum sp.]